MQRNVVKHTLNAPALHVGDEPGALIQISALYIVHMRVVHTALGNNRLFDQAMVLQRTQGLVIIVPAAQPVLIDEIGRQKLSP